MTAHALRVGSYGNGSFSLNGLTQAEVDLLLGVFRGGFHWVRLGNDGRLRSVPAHEELPEPAVDEEMHPFWQPSSAAGGVQLELFPLDGAGGVPARHSSPSITIQSLCGYSYNADNYRFQADLLASYGFNCLRSPRDKLTGQFWEIWYLSGQWAAKGRLKEAIVDSGHTDEVERTKVAVEFLRGNVEFGTLDVAIQRLAAVMRD